MRVFQGVGVSPGVAVGRVHHVGQVLDEVVPRRIDDPQAELARFESARALAATQLAELAVSTASKLGEKNSLLFEIHQMMLDDVDYRQAVELRIRGAKMNVEAAVSETAKELAKEFSEMDDAYMQARSADVLDVSRRVVEILLGKEPQNPNAAGSVIMASLDFAPSQTAKMEPSTTLAMITCGGSANSHTAIFARTMGIPAVIGLAGVLDESWDGRECVVDGATGQVVLDPDAEHLEKAAQKMRERESQAASLEAYRGKPAVTKSGKSIKIFANIGSLKDAKAAVAADAEGVGLFRSEFLYLESQGWPSEERQFEAYKAVAEILAGRQVVIRTLDIGADKQAPYFKLPKEENPALGLRAIRFCLRRPDIFKTQLRAIYRASAYGDVAIMLPMVVSAWEVRAARKLAAEAREELSKEGAPMAERVPIGIMIETPASAVISDALAKESDFFSVGTNDLTQYALAADRQNKDLAEFCDPRHEAVLRLIKLAADNAHAAGIWIGICGELGADEALAGRFIEMGVDELSVTPPAILPLKKVIRELE